MLKAGGHDLVKSLQIIFNKIMNQRVIPTSWKIMTIKSIYKNKGKRTEMKNRRGIFLTNIVSKLFEKILANRNENLVRDHLSNVAV